MILPNLIVCCKCSIFSRLAAEKTQQAKRTGPLESEIYKSTKENLSEQIAVASQIIAHQIIECEKSDVKTMECHPVIFNFPSMGKEIIMVGSTFRTASGLRNWAKRNQIHFAPEVLEAIKIHEAFALVEGEATASSEAATSVGQISEGGHEEKTVEKDESTDDKEEEEKTEFAGAKPKVFAAEKDDPTASKRSVASLSSELKDLLEINRDDDKKDDGQTSVGTAPTTTVQVHAADIQEVEDVSGAEAVDLETK